MKNKKLITVICSIVVFLIIFIPLQIMILKIVYPKKYTEYVYEYSEENNIDPLLTFAIIKAESNFERNSLSQSGAIGLMQLMPETAEEVLKDIGIDLTIKEELYNEEKNIKIGTKYYALLYERYNHKMELALAAYNAGIGNVDKWIEEGIIKDDGSDIENIPYKETNNYVRKILRDYAIYKVLYNNK